MNTSTAVCFSLFLIGVLIALAQLWFRVWYPDTFFKIIFTDGAFFAISFVWAFLVKESRETRKINSKNSLD